MRRIALMLLFALAITHVNAQQAMKLMVNFGDSKDFSHENLYQPYTKISTVTLNPKLLNDKECNVGDKLSINLFDGEMYSSTIDRINTNINGTVSIRARLDDYPMGFLLISTTDNLSLGSIWIPEKKERYSLKTSSKTGITYLKKLDISKLDEIEGGPSIIAPGYPLLTDDQIEQFKKAAAKDPSDPANVDVMIVYTPAAVSWAGSNEGSIFNTISQAMEMAQIAADNSLLIMSFTLVHSELVIYTESGSSSTDLYRLTFHEGFDPWGYEGTPRYLEEVHGLRDLYGADLVSMFTQVDDTGGVGWLLAYQTGNPPLGFSISRVQQASWTFTHVHEMGHNMGAHHHKLQNVQPGPTNWNDWPENTWSAGWRWLGSDEQMYCDIMTYENGSYFSDGITATRTPYFSNPSISHMGAPTGNSVDGDNARTLREIKHVIAAYTVGGSVEPPIISVDPETLYQALGYNSQASQTLSVSNEVVDGGNLNISLSIIYEDSKNSKILSPELIHGVTGNQKTLADQTKKTFSTENISTVKSLSSAKGASVLYINTVAEDANFLMALQDLANVSSFEEIDGTVVTPNVDYMLNYDMVIVAANSGFSNATLLGNNLADYVDAGGSVCILQGALSSGGGWTLAGNIVTADYCPLAISSFSISDVTCTEFIEHPLTSSMTTISTGIWSIASTQGAGISLGNYNTGYPFAAYNPEKPIVAINVFPADDWWSGDLIQMMQNTIDWLMSQKGWLSLSSYGAIISNGNSHDIDVIFNSNELDQGIYEAMIRITSNDPENPEVIIPVTLEVTFESFTLTLEASPVDGGTVEGAGDYYAGQEVSINAIHNPGYMFINWTDEEEVELFTQASATFTMPAENKTLTAHFTDQFPIISLDPEYFDEIVYVGETGESSLTIFNTGDYNLSFNIEVIDAKKNVSKREIRQSEKSTQSEQQKGVELPNLHLNNPKTSKGGPDAFGYSWSTTAINWINASSGTSVSLSDDDYITGIPLGFNFTYYGESYSQINIMSNGWVSFTNSYSWYPDCVPGGYGGAIVPFGIDLNPTSGGYIKYLSGGSVPQRYFVVEFNSIRLYGSDTHQTFQVVFYESNNAIRFQYLTAPVVPYSIGIENADGSIGMGNCGDGDLYINPNIVANNMAIEFTLYNPDWLSLSSYTGTVLPGEQADLGVFFDATELSLGTYDKIIRVSSNDPENPELDIPFTLNVVLELFTLSLEANPAEGGTVEGSGEYWEGYEVTINATPNPGFIFEKWTEDGEELTRQAVYTFDMPAEDLTLIANFTDKIPEISYEPDFFEEDLFTGDIVTRTLTISNTGDPESELYFSMDLDFLSKIKNQSVTINASSSRSSSQLILKNNGNIDLSSVEVSPNSNGFNPDVVNSKSFTIDDLLFSFPVGVGDGEYGVGCDGQYIYTTKWSGEEFYKYTLGGEYLSSFTIAGVSDIRDLTYDGQYFYGSPNSNTIYIMNFTSEALVGTITTTVPSIRAIAYDSDNDGFWVSNGWDGPLRLISRSAEVLQSITTSFGNLAGLAWDNTSPDGPSLWAYTQNNNGHDLYQIDIATSSTIQTFDVATLEITTGPSAGGAFISNSVVPGHITLMGMSQNDVIWGLSLGNASTDWLSLSELTGTLNYGESIDIDVTFDATGFFGGVYEAIIAITSNDPENSEVQIPVTMNVTGVPILELSHDVLDFGDVQIDVPEVFELTVYNVGTQTLEVTDIESSLSNFTVSETELFISPLSNASLLVTFESASTGLYEATLSFSTNDTNNPTVALDMIAEAKLPPAISVSPTSFYEYLGYNESTEGTLTITNNGEMPLEFSITSFLDNTNPSKSKFDQTINLGLQTLTMENHPDRPTVTVNDFIQYNVGSKVKADLNILIYEEVPDFYWYTETLDGLGYSYTSAGSWAALETALTGDTQWDLVLVNSYNYNAYSGVIDELDAYANSGGRFIFAHWQEMDFSSHPISTTMGISFVSNFTTPINFSLTGEASIFNAPNVLPDNFTWTHNQYNTDGQIVETLAGATRMAIFAGYPNSAAVVLNEGGNTIFNAFQADNFSGDSNSSGKDDIQELIENQITYLLANNLVVSPTSGTVLPGEDFDITVTFSSNGLTPGIYEGTISIASNDLDNPVIDVPVTLDVDYEGPVYYTLALLTDPDDIGAVVTGAGNYTEETTVVITASWVSGYTFTGWTGSADDVALLGNPLAATTSLSMPARAVTLTANYEEEVPFDCNVTFNVDMTDAVGFDPDGDVVYITGSMMGWAEPGSEPENQTLTRIGETMIWTKTLVLETGEYQYKYFLNDGWAGGEWDGEPNRIILVTNHMIQSDIWGEIVDTYSVTLLADPDDIGAVLIGAGNYYEDAEVILTASSVDGYIFTGWTGITADVELLDDATASTATFTMPARGVTLTATYEEEAAPTYSVTFIVRNSSQTGIEGATISITGAGSITTNASGIAIATLENGSYSYTVTATGYYTHSGSFTVAGANQQVIVTMVTVGVETEVLSALEVFPNPFSSNITLNNASGVSRVTITNIIGQRVMDMSLSGSERIIIPTDGLTNGVYLMVFEAENGERVIRKMVKK